MSATSTAQRRWNLVVTELGVAAPLHEVVVEAGDWMTALVRARTTIGERGGVPPGASCAVSPDGLVTILDGVARRQYRLTPTTAPLSVAPAPAAAPTPAAAPAKKVSKATVAYMASPLAGAAGPQVPVAGPASAAPASAPAPAPASARPAAKPISVPAPAQVPKPASIPPAPVAPAKPASIPPASVAPAVAATPAAPSAPPAELTKKKVSKATVAYLPNAAALAGAAAPIAVSATPASAPPAAAGPIAAASPAAAAPAAAVAPASAPAASVPAAPPAAAPALAAPIAAAPAPAPVATDAAVAPTPAAGVARPVPSDGAELLHARDAEPSKQTPLVYRERTFVVAPGTDADEAEMIVRRRFAALREELEARPKGKLVNMAVFDHRWEGRPERPPLVALQWKDWKGEPEIHRPTSIPSERPAAMSMPTAQALAAMPAAAPAPAQAAPEAAAAQSRTPSRSGSVAPRARSMTPGPDERLTAAFEQLQDLFFLGTPLEGAEFVLDLVAELVPAEAAGVCLYDINSDELRFVALRGPGAEERKGDAIPMGVGLLGAAAIEFERPILIEEVPTDPRYDPGVDGRVGIDPRTMALVPVVHQSRLQAVLQLVNRRGQAQFGKSDSNVLAYIGEKLGEFLHQSRLAQQERPAAPRGTRPR